MACGRTSTRDSTVHLKRGDSQRNDHSCDGEYPEDCDDTRDYSDITSVRYSSPIFWKA